MIQWSYPTTSRVSLSHTQTRRTWSTPGEKPASITLASAAKQVMRSVGSCVGTVAIFLPHTVLPSVDSPLQLHPMRQRTLTIAFSNERVGGVKEIYVRTRRRRCEAIA